MIAIAATAQLGQAALVFTLDTTEVTARPGETLSFEGLLANDGNRRLNLYGFGWYAPSGFVRDLYSTSPIGSLGPDASYRGPLFDLQIAKAAELGDHEIRVDAGGYDPKTDEDSFASQTIKVHVVPEPATTFVALLLPLIGFLRRVRPTGS